MIISQFQSMHLSIRNALIQLVQTEFVYDGNIKIPSIQFVAYNGNFLIEGVDYVTTYDTAREVGTYNFTVFGIGKYTDFQRLTFSVVPRRANIQFSQDEFEFIAVNNTMISIPIHYDGDGTLIVSNGAVIQNNNTLKVRVTGDTYSLTVQAINEKNTISSIVYLTVITDTFPDNIADATPMQIKNACSLGFAARIWNVGDKIPLFVLNGVSIYAYIVNITNNEIIFQIGKTQDSVDICITDVNNLYEIIPEYWQQIINDLILPDEEHIFGPNQYQYYANGNSNFIKYRYNDTTQPEKWRLDVKVVNENGELIEEDESGGIAPIFIVH